jgi:hypothetical protein
MRCERVNERLNALAPRYGFDVVARRALQSSSIGGRIRNTDTRPPADASPDLQEQLGSSNALVSFYAAAALVLIDASRAMPGIMNQLAERESWPGEAMARLLVDAGTDISGEPIRALMLSLAPDKVPPLLPWLSHVDAVLGSTARDWLLRRNPDHEEIAAAALLVVRTRDYSASSRFCGLRHPHRRTSRSSGGLAASTKRDARGSEQSRLVGATSRRGLAEAGL